MQTAVLALDWLAAKGVVFEANADWQGELTPSKEGRATDNPP